MIVSTRQVSAFDQAAAVLSAARSSMSESELLADALWAIGEDARLREDIRFRATPWGRWIPSTDYLANDCVVQRLREGTGREPGMDAILEEMDASIGRRCVLCPGDPRIVVDDDAVRLSADELSDRPLVLEDIDDLAKFTTHLPVHDLSVAAACTKPDNWDRLIHEQMVGTLGWLQVELPGRRLNDQQFVARVTGHSMDGGPHPVRDGDYCVFKFWPVGTDSKKPYLVRGSFQDSETGWYALKQVAADRRDAEGEHQWLELVSWNPDREKYPSRRVAAEDAGDFSFVAELVTVLTPANYARTPRPQVKRGRRDLTSPRATESIIRRLQEQLSRFFADGKTPGVDGERSEPEAWQMNLVCLDAASGGLCIELGPLHDLRSFVKRLRVCGRQWETQLLSSNVRTRSARLCVPPASGPWRVEAVGFEDDPDIDLSALELTRPDGPVTVFRVDADGTGRLVEGARLSLGQQYRLLFSADCWAGLSGKPSTMELPGGWHLVELSLSDRITPETATFLSEIGVCVTGSQPQVVPFGLPPVEWHNHAKGTRYPCYAKGMSVAFRVVGLNEEDLATVSVFVQGPGRMHRLDGLGTDGVFEIRDAEQGGYICSLLHRRKSILPTTVAFAMLPGPPSLPEARCFVNVGARRLQATSGSQAQGEPMDLADAALQADLDLTGPPGWPVRVTWRLLADEFLGETHAETDGSFDPSVVLGMVRERASKSSTGDLVLDFRELGRVVLRHHRERSLESVRSGVLKLVEDEAQIIRQMRGQFSVLVPMWFCPLCALLGYWEVEALPEMSAPPEHAAAYELVCIQRDHGEYRRRPARVLVLVENLAEEMDPELRSWSDGLCNRESMREMLLSDGLRWAARRRGSKLPLQVHDLSELADEGSLDGFLRAAGEGI